MGRYIESDIDDGQGYMSCMDCGAIVYDSPSHDRFHAILNHHGKACALLQVAHLAPHVHDKYDVYDKIGNPKDSWSADAFEEVTGINPNGKTPTKPKKEDES